jgi:hypothetical protein
MVNQPNLSIPENLTPDTRCLCLQIPDDPTWIQNFVGLLAIPRYWFNWDRDEARSGKILANYWSELFDQIDWSTMSCCCNQPPAIFRYNSDNVYQMSTDGGTTWVDAPQYDYRNTSITFPPPSAVGIDNTKCQAADSAVVILNEDVIQGLDNGAAVQALLEFIAAVLIFYLSAGTLATVSIGLFSMAAAIIGFGVASTKAAFTTTVLNQLRCSIFCAMNSGDSINATGLAVLLDDINSNYTGIVKTSLYSLISAAGVVGINNMLRSNRGDPAADCTGCGCGDCTNLNDWGIQTYNGHPVGVEISRGDNYIILEGTGHPDFGTPYNAIIKTPTTVDCCQVTNFETISGDGLDYHLFYVACGAAQWPVGGFSSWPGPTNCPAANQLFIRKDSGTNFRVKITFAAP